MIECFQKENFDSQGKERNVSEIMKDKDMFIVHGINLWDDENCKFILTPDYIKFINEEVNPVRNYINGNRD